MHTHTHAMSTPKEYNCCGCMLTVTVAEQRTTLADAVAIHCCDACYRQQFDVLSDDDEEEEEAKKPALHVLARPSHAHK